MKHKPTILILVISILLIISNCSKNEEIQITTSSNDARDLFIDGRENHELIEYEKAAEIFDKALELDPNFALANLYRYFTGIGDNIKYYSKAFDNMENVSEGEKYFLLAYKSWYSNDDAAVKENMNKLTELYPNDKRAQYLRGNFYYNNNEYDKAIEYYNKALSIDKKYAPVYNNLGYVYILIKNYDEAEKAFMKQIELIPNRPNPYDSYAELLSTIGKYDESIEQYQKAYDTDNSFVMAFEGIGDNYVLKGEFETAREYYQKQSFEGSDISAKLGTLYDIANSYIYEGEIDKAIEKFDEYSSLAKSGNHTADLVYSYIYKGTVLTETGNPIQGLSNFQQALKIAQGAKLPNSIKNNLIIYSKVNECNALIMNNYKAEALAKINEIKELTKDRKSIADEKRMNWLQGLLAYWDNDFTTALDYFPLSYPENSLVKYYTAKAYQATGENETADKIFDELRIWKTVGLQPGIVSYLLG